MESILVDFYNLELDLADFIEKNWEPGYSDVEIKGTFWAFDFVENAF